MFQKINESVACIAKLTSIQPSTGIILGSGLGAFVEEIKVVDEIPFSAIPHFPVSGVEGHKGALLFGYLGERPLVIMQGRVHYYEGFTMEQITFPVRVMKFLGIENLLLSNAAGGINPDFKTGDLMVISDHINLMPSPLIGDYDKQLGPRFSDMSRAYDAELIDRALAVAKKAGIPVRQGVYVGVTGPTYETPAEYKFFRIIGGDAVGMSTVPEVIVARQMDLRCLAISVITDLGIPGKIEFLSHHKVQKAAMKAEPKLAEIFKGIIKKF